MSQNSNSPRPATGSAPENGCQTREAVGKPFDPHLSGSEMPLPDQGGRDLRSPLAKARDAWLDSEEGQRACDPAILQRRELAQYLRNRIELAFLAGANAQAAISRPPQSERSKGGAAEPLPVPQPLIGGGETIPEYLARQRRRNGASVSGNDKAQRPLADSDAGRKGKHETT